MTNNFHEHNSRARVGVIGSGAVTAFGVGVDVLWNGVLNGVTAISEVEHLSTEGYSTRFGGELKDPLPPSPVSDEVDGFRDRSYDMMFAAAEEALGGAAPIVEKTSVDRIGVVLATCNAGLLSTAEWYSNSAAHRHLARYGTPQAMAESVAEHFRFAGPVISVNTACAAGANAVGLAAEIISGGQADVVLVVGADALTDLTFAGFNSLGSLSPRPAAPYDANRSGLSLGEGSGAILLASFDVATSQNILPLAEILGYGLSADGFHPTAPHPEGVGAARAITAALHDGETDPAYVGYVNTHGTGTSKNDSAEALATVAAIPSAQNTTPVSSSKSMIGHLLGAAGVVEAIITVQAISHQIVPPTANLNNPDPAIEIYHVRGSAKQRAFRVAVSNNFAFGGANASLVLASVRETPRHRSRPARPRQEVVLTGTSTRIAEGTNSVLPDTVYTDRQVALVTAEAAHTLASISEHTYLSRRDGRRMDRQGILSVLSTGEALADAGLLEAYTPEDFGVVFGTALGPMEAMEDFYLPVLQSGANAANPALYPSLVYNAAAGLVATHHRLLGPTSTVTTGHAAGTSALVYAADLIKQGKATGMVSVATDVVTDTIVRAFVDSGVPFRTQPIRLAEGTAAIALESAENVRFRGGRPLARVLAHAMSFDHNRQNKASETAMRLAIERAGLTLDDVSAVWTAECGWTGRDEPLRRAFEHTFANRHAERRPTWELTAEPFGVGGLARTAMAAAEINSGRDEVAVVNSSSWGGAHQSVVLAPPENH